MIYFTSDLHIGHDKEFIWGSRGFSSIEEHDTEILKRWNSIVTFEDTVYILGDLCMSGNEKEWNRIYKNLNGKEKIFIIGNHDTANKIDKYIFDYDMIYSGYATMYRYSKKYNFYLSHYPTYTANYEDKKHPIINLHGHTHQKDKFFNNNPYMYNVALDAHDCKPVSINEIIKDIEEFKL